MNITLKKLPLTNRKGFVIAAFAAMLLALSAAQAAVVEVQQKGWGKGENALCCDAMFETRYGNNATGDLMVTLGGSAPIVIDLPGADEVASNGYGMIGLFVTSNGKKDFAAKIDNLVLSSNATGTYDVLNDPLATGVKKDKSNAILLTEEVYGLFSDCTISGDMTFSWTGNKIKKHDLKFMVGVPDQVVVPVPAALWLFGSALGLLGAVRRL